MKKSFKIKSLFKIESKFKIKPIFKLFTIMIMMIMLCACNKELDNKEQISQHKDEFSKPDGILQEVGIDTSVADGVEEKSVFDNMTEKSEYASNDNESVDSNLDISEIKEVSVQNIIKKIASDNNYESFEIIEVYEDKMTSTIGYTIKFSDNSYWIIMYSIESGQAYAVKDEYGSYGEQSQSSDIEEAEDSELDVETTNTNEVEETEQSSGILEEGDSNEE